MKYKKKTGDEETMIHFKKIIAFFLVAIIVLTVCSCNKTVDEEDGAAYTEEIEIINPQSPNSTVVPDNVQKPTEDNTNVLNGDTTVSNQSNATDNQPGKNEQQTVGDEPPQSTLTSPDSTVNDNNTEPEIEPDTNDEPEIDLYEAEMEFLTYQSNTFVPTGNHSALFSKNVVTKTFRGVFPVQQYGKLDYCFYFSNNVDSTWSDGSETYRDMPTEQYKILSAAIMTTTNEQMSNVKKRTQITFDGQKSRTVEAGEMFWCDPVSFTVAEGEYLVFEWKVQYTMIPCTKIKGTSISFESSTGTSFVPATEGVPMPNMIGANRNKELNMAFIGDSITAGEGAGAFNGYVAQISKKMGDTASIWNLGLGYARANDVVNSPAWLKKAKTASTVAICFGVNDINSGAYQVGTRTVKEIVDDIAYIAKQVSDAGAKVVIFSTPPYTYKDQERVQKWRDVVKGLEKLAKENRYSYFDFASCLGSPDDASKPAYGGHPNGDGCTVAANAFMNAYQNGTLSLKK